MSPVRDDELDEPEHVVIKCSVERSVRERQLVITLCVRKWFSWPSISSEKGADNEIIKERDKFTYEVVYKYDNEH